MVQSDCFFSFLASSSPHRHVAHISPNPILCVPYQWNREHRQLTNDLDKIHQFPCLKHQVGVWRNKNTSDWPTASLSLLSSGAHPQENHHTKSVNYRMTFSLTWSQGGLSFVSSLVSWVILQTSCCFKLGNRYKCIWMGISLNVLYHLCKKHGQSWEKQIFIFEMQ